MKMIKTYGISIPDLKKHTLLDISRCHITNKTWKEYFKPCETTSDINSDFWIFELNRDYLIYNNAVHDYENSNPFTDSEIPTDLALILWMMYIKDIKAIIVRETDYQDDITELIKEEGYLPIYDYTKKSKCIYQPEWCTRLFGDINKYNKSEK